MQNWKKILKVICFWLIFIYFFINISYVLRRDSDIKDRFAGFYSLSEDSLDMIIIGSSPVHPSWGASLAYGEYGFTSYPISTNVQQPRMTEFLVSEVLKTQSPEVLVIETRMFMHEQAEYDEHGGVESHIRNVVDNVKYSLDRINFINAMVTEDREAYWFDIMKYHSNWKLIGVDALGYWNNERKSKYKGFLFMPEVKRVELLVDNTKINEREPIPKEQEAVLLNIMKYVNDNNQKVLFVLNPYQISEEECRMANYMEMIIEEAGYEFVNFNRMNEELDLDYNTDFYDTGHMNVLGAEKYTRSLAEILEQDYQLPDHRGDAEYGEWNEAYEIWLEQADTTKQEIYLKIQDEG